MTQASGVTVSSAGTDFASVEGEADTSEWFIPSDTPNMEWIGTGPVPYQWDGESEDDMTVEEGSVSSKPVQPAEGRGVEIRDFRDRIFETDVKRSKRPLSRKVLKTMLPCFPVY